MLNLACLLVIILLGDPKREVVLIWFWETILTADIFKILAVNLQWLKVVKNGRRICICVQIFSSVSKLVQISCRFLRNGKSTKHSDISFLCHIVPKLQSLSGLTAKQDEALGRKLCEFFYYLYMRNSSVSLKSFVFYSAMQCSLYAWLSQLILRINYCEYVSYFPQAFMPLLFLW